MKNTRVIALTISLFLLAGFLYSAKRAQRDPGIIASLSNPHSQNFVPFPFPQERREIVADLIHFMKSRKSPLTGKVKMTFSKKMEYSLVHGDGDFRVGRILKVPNRIAMVKAPYVFVIQINHADGHTVAFYGLEDTGLFSGSSVVADEASSFASLRNAEEIRKYFSDRFSSIVGNGGGILAVSPVHLRHSLHVCYFHQPPTWVIELKNGRKYLCFEISSGMKRKSRFFQVARSVGCRYGKGGDWDEVIRKERDQGHPVALDSINDRILVLDEIQ